MANALTIMRLQPLHNGHKKIIDQMLKENKKVILLIGSIDKNDKKNPYSFEQRKEMVYQIYFKEIQENKLFVKGIKDINNPPKWASFVKQQLPFETSVYYCGSDQDGHLFEKEGFSIKLFNREELPISGTNIRKKIADGSLDWKNDVPCQIHHLI
jgi:cytidyltransferase-like protein